MPRLIELKTSQGSAWRAVYLYVNHPRIGRMGCAARDPKVFHIGVDPRGGEKPALFGSVYGHEFRVTLPYVAWRYPMGRIRSAAYQLSQRFWLALDGRYGCGGSCR